MTHPKIIEYDILFYVISSKNEKGFNEGIYLRLSHVCIRLRHFSIMEMSDTRGLWILPDEMSSLVDLVFFIKLLDTITTQFVERNFKYDFT